jgi:hypothetical protein
VEVVDAASRLARVMNFVHQGSQKNIGNDVFVIIDENIGIISSSCQWC